jgi:hypothetical protein
MKKLLLCVLLLGCNGGNGQSDAGPDMGVADTGSPDVGPAPDGGIPPMPTLGTQIDRMGRPAINTALNHTFDPACTPTACVPKDTYNADTNVASWATTYVPEFKANLAILDSLDMVCGNQAAYGLGGEADYTALATLLADDQLYVDTSKSTCSTYLAVELNATGLATNTDCGGRMMTYDVIWTTYTATATGKLDNSVTDGLSGSVPAKTSGTMFPYLAPPL